MKLRVRAAVVKDKKLNLLPKEHIVNKVSKEEGREEKKGGRGRIC